MPNLIEGERPEVAAALDAAIREAKAALERLAARDAFITGAMRDALEAGKIAQRMVGRLLNAVFFLGIVNVILMTALVLQAVR